MLVIKTFISDRRPSVSVPSKQAQTLLCKALSEHATSPATIALVAVSSKSIQNSSLAANLAVSFVIDLITIGWFETVFAPTPTQSVQFASDLSFSLCADFEDGRKKKFTDFFAALKNEAISTYFRPSITSARFDRFDFCRNLFIDGDDGNKQVFPNLISLEFNWCSDELFFRKASKTSNPKDCSFVALALPPPSVAPNLRLLKLVGCRNFSWVDDPAQLEILSEFHQLEDLNFHRCTWIRNQDLQHLVHLKRLVHLNLTDCNRVNDIGVTNYLSQIPSLQQLVLGGLCDITDASLLQIGNHLEELRLLSFRDCYNVTDDGVAHLGKLSNLSSLSLYCCYRVTDKSLEVFLKWKTSLKMLNLDGVQSFGEESRAKLREQIPQIRFRQL